MGDKEVNWGDEKVREKLMGDEKVREGGGEREWKMKRWKMICERERKSEKEGKMIWTYVGVGIMTWRCLEEKKKIFSPF